jgi:hypothetical protein
MTKASPAPFIHILAFQCPQCQRPVVEWVLSSLRSPESIDAATLNLKCSCGWSGVWLGAQARRHPVLAWPPASDPSADHEDPAGARRTLDAEGTGAEDTLNTL